MNLQTNFVKNGKSTILDFYFFPGPGCPGGGQNSYCKGTPWLNVSTPAPSPLHSTQSSSSHYTTNPMYIYMHMMFCFCAVRDGVASVREVGRLLQALLLHQRAGEGPGLSDAESAGRRDVGSLPSDILPQNRKHEKSRKP
jgi:hypothetical protein